MANPAFYSTLKNGSKGPDVALVQTWLNGLANQTGAGAIAVDGIFGDETTRQVRGFQLAKKLKEDGMVGAETWNTLYNAHREKTGVEESFPGISMKPGDEGAAVRSVQLKLQKLMPAVKADGKFGEQTRDGVMMLQRLKNLPATGVVDRTTWYGLKTETE